MKQKKGIKIWYLISGLVLFTAIFISFINWYTSSITIKTTMSENILNNNYNYAQKVALNTTVLLEDMQQNIENLAGLLGEERFTQQELDRWLGANSNYFNSLFILDDNGVVQIISPQSAENSKVKPGTKIKSDLMTKSLVEKKPFISNPYRANSGHLMVLVSHPIVEDGVYKGTINGAIYLEEDSSFKRLLMKQETMNNSSVMVVDSTGNVIYHTEEEWINQSLTHLPVVQNVIQGEKGKIQFVGEDDIEYFAGYASIDMIKWGIVTKTPASVIQHSQHSLIKKMILQSLPFIFAIFIIAILFANAISRPLTKLANFSKQSFNLGHSESMDTLENKSMIAEVKQLYHDLRLHLNLLTDQNQTDALTGLMNRRMFDNVIEDWVNHQIPFSVIMLDIDNFKLVNDTYGHLVGDDVLKYLASILNEGCRQEDFCFRYGGEEFVILLKNKNLEQAITMAERLKEKITNTISPTGKVITLSIGVTKRNVTDEYSNDIIERADQALYYSKMNGRNMITIKE